MRTVRVGTRGSALALWQTEHVRERLHAVGIRTERVEIRTTGDIVADTPLSRIGGRALFTRQLDEALLDGTIDLAVHSLKDLPTTLPAGIALAAVSEREDPRDALIGRGAIAFDGLPRGAVVATSSLRRRAQLLRARPDLQVTDLRGNVNTRLAKLDATPAWSAIVLAVAGVARLGLAGRIGERLSPDVMLPAPGQGALGVTIRADDRALLDAVASIHHRMTALATAAERALLRRLEGGCQVPVAALADVSDGERLRLRGRVIALDGGTTADGAQIGRARDVEEAEALGVALAEELLDGGARAILAEVRAASLPPVSEP